MGAVGFLLHHWLGHVIFARVIWGLAGLILALGLCYQPAYRPIHRFGHWFGTKVGILLTHILLVTFYYLVFFPVAIILKIQGRDPMHRKPRDPRYTWWIRRQQTATTDSYKRQFLIEDRAARGELRLLDRKSTGSKTMSDEVLNGRLQPQSNDNIPPEER